MVNVMTTNPPYFWLFCNVYVLVFLCRPMPIDSVLGQLCTHGQFDILLEQILETDLVAVSFDYSFPTWINSNNNIIHKVY